MPAVIQSVQVSEIVGNEVAITFQSYIDPQHLKEHFRRYGTLYIDHRPEGDVLYVNTSKSGTDPLVVIQGARNLTWEDVLFASADKEDVSDQTEYNSNRGTSQHYGEALRGNTHITDVKTSEQYIEMGRTIADEQLGSMRQSDNMSYLSSADNAQFLIQEVGHPQPDLDQPIPDSLSNPSAAIDEAQMRSLDNVNKMIGIYLTRATGIPTEMMPRLMYVLINGQTFQRDSLKDYWSRTGLLNDSETMNFNE